MSASYEEASWLVCNAGVFMSAPFGQIGEEGWEWLMQTNLLGAVRATKGCMPALREAKGAVVFVNNWASVIPSRPRPHRVVR